MKVNNKMKVNMNNKRKVNNKINNKLKMNNKIKLNNKIEVKSNRKRKIGNILICSLIKRIMKCRFQLIIYHFLKSNKR